MENTDIFEIFRTNANPEKAISMKSYMRNQFEFLGIPTPERRKISKEYLKNKDKDVFDWKFVFECWDQPEREFQYLAIDYLSKYSRLLSDKDIVNLTKITVQKSWWDTIDGLDRIFGDVALRYPETKKILLKYSLDENFWIRRIAIDHQLGLKDMTDTELLS
ncbi:MAG: DNA alkylation repair protein, partial [Clostridioides sp.]|nr:DNA alkylation repair protein [Clostridioides sp.]